MYYLLLDQRLVRCGKGDTDGLIVFGGWVHADRNTSPLEKQVFAGVLQTADFIGRPQDRLGFAASWFQLSGALTAPQQLEQSLGIALSGGGLGTPVGVQSSEAELQLAVTERAAVCLHPRVPLMCRGHYPRQTQCLPPAGRWCRGTSSPR